MQHFENAIPSHHMSRLTKMRYNLSRLYVIQNHLGGFTVEAFDSILQSAFVLFTLHSCTKRLPKGLLFRNEVLRITEEIDCFELETSLSLTLMASIGCLVSSSSLVPLSQIKIFNCPLADQQYSK